MPRRITNFRPRVRSRHRTHDILRTGLRLLPFRSVVRLGSTTEVAVPGIIECNTTDAVRISSNKRLMKDRFTQARVKTADWYIIDRGEFFKQNQLEGNNRVNIGDLPYPIVAKHVHGSRGNGNYLLNTQQELENWMRGKTLSSYIFEKFYSYSREYRLHVTEEGCFYTCRKMLRNDVPDNQRWFRNDSNSVWIVEENPQFDRPTNWNDIVNDCVTALKAVGLDVGAFDVRVQSARDNRDRVREEVKYIVLESNSAPSFGDITAQKYLEQIPRILQRKQNELRH